MAYAMVSDLHAPDSATGLIVGGGGTVALLNIKYPDNWSADRLSHALLQQGPRVPERLAGVAAQLAIACLCRDRLFSDCYPRTAGLSFGERSGR